MRVCWWRAQGRSAGCQERLGCGKACFCKLSANCEARNVEAKPGQGMRERCHLQPPEYTYEKQSGDFHLGFVTASHPLHIN